MYIIHFYIIIYNNIAIPKIKNIKQYNQYVFKSSNLIENY